jgi:hypothetical protein
MKRLLSTHLLSPVLAGAAHAQKPDFGPPIPSPAVQGLDGRWEGGIETPEGTLTGVFRVTTAGDKTTTMMDSPMQDVTDLPAIAKRDGKSIVIEVPIVNGDFTGELSADAAQMKGAWHQNGIEFHSFCCGSRSRLIRSLC